MNALPNLRRAVGALLAVATLGLLGAACSKSVPQALCSTICDCEHCATQTEDLTCAGLEAQLRVATDYGCDDKWNAWADCAQAQGACVETKATFSTMQAGHCTRLYDIGLPCAQTSECGALGVKGATCISGHCQMKQCEESGQSCTVDAECVTAEDKCGPQATDLAACEAAASGHAKADTTGAAPPSSPGAPSPAGG